VGVGPQGQSYAIPTKGRGIQSMALTVIRLYVNQFIQYAWQNNYGYCYRTFFVTSIGCGLAGYKPEDIAPMFKGAPLNCSFPDVWKPYLE
jgi:hypothetical protein